MKVEYELVNKMRALKKPFFTVADLAKLLERSREDIYLLAHRLTKAGVIKMIVPGTYRLSDKPSDFTMVAHQLYWPSYLSFETALANEGILNQIPYALIFATTRKPKTIVLENQQEIQYRRLKKELFFGYRQRGDVYIAEPEKALLDQLYMVSKGKATLDWDELNLKGLKKTLFLKYAKKFPKPTQKLAKKLLGQFGKTSVTIK